MTVWRDIHPDFKLGANGDIKVSTDVEAIYSSIDNILRTVLGERVMRRSFPGFLSGLLFEPIRAEAVKQQAQDEIVRAINKWDDRVKMNYLEIIVDQDNDSVSVNAEFYIKGYDNVFTFNRNF